MLLVALWEVVGSTYVVSLKENDDGSFPFETLKWMYLAFVSWKVPHNLPKMLSPSHMLLLWKKLPKEMSREWVWKQKIWKEITWECR